MSIGVPPPRVRTAQAMHAVPLNSISIFCVLGKKSGMNVVQVFPEDGNMGRVLPKYLTEWTTNKVRKG